MTTHDAEPQGAIDSMDHRLTIGMETDTIDPQIWKLLEAYSTWDRIEDEFGPESAESERIVQSLARQLTARLAAHDQSDPSEGDRE